MSIPSIVCVLPVPCRSSTRGALSAIAYFTAQQHCWRRRGRRRSYGLAVGEDGRVESAEACINERSRPPEHVRLRGPLVEHVVESVPGHRAGALGDQDVLALHVQQLLELALPRQQRAHPRHHDDALGTAFARCRLLVATIGVHSAGEKVFDFIM